MKKKHLRSLSTVENWLEKQGSLNADLKKSFISIRNAIESVEIDEEGCFPDSLPAPKEIAGEPHTFALFCDGGCRGNPGPGAYAYVVQDVEGKIIAEGVDFEAHTTNNKMELSGPLRGLQDLKNILPEIG